MMKIGESLKRNGSPMKSIGKKNRKNTDNNGEAFTRKNKHHSRKKLDLESVLARFMEASEKNE